MPLSSASFARCACGLVICLLGKTLVKAIVTRVLKLLLRIGVLKHRKNHLVDPTGTQLLPSPPLPCCHFLPFFLCYFLASTHFFCLLFCLVLAPLFYSLFLNYFIIFPFSTFFSFSDRFGFYCVGASIPLEKAYLIEVPVRVVSYAFVGILTVIGMPFVTLTLKKYQA